ncbi:hypothetical protein [Pontibacter sp. HSC-36F09]|uniref:hypothetical protein n=1 Tax=Pontibacter sp. HSC-36F09 TaxID=2910966 RepID=UPI0020A19AD1|nr:hypothetical protein [Pontibacter sp. HSC-36F09]MCP2043795.1 hypothetical protein [Pontibacter sp. HSC-36F09]
MNKEFSTRFNYKLFLLSLLLAPLLFVAGMGLLKLIKDIYAGRAIDDLGFTLVFPLVVIAFVIYSIYFYWSKSPKIKINPEAIKIGNEVIRIQEIESIQIYSHSNSFFLFVPYTYAEVSSIKLKNGVEYKLFVEHYSNGSRLRVCLNELDKYLRGERNVFEIPESTKTTILQRYDLENFITFKNSPLKSFMNCGYLSVVIFCLLMIISGGIPWAINPLAGTGILILLCSMFYFALVWQNHYFMVSDNFLLVKNDFFPWRKKAFHLTGIDTVSSQLLPKQETSLKIITTDYRIYRYQSSLLDDKQFLSLIRKIRNNKRSLLKRKPSLAF